MKDLRIAAHLTAFELAVESGVSVASINRMEKGGHTVARLTAVKVLDVLSKKLGRAIRPEEIEGLRISDER